MWGWKFLQIFLLLWVFLHSGALVFAAASITLSSDTPDLQNNDVYQVAIHLSISAQEGTEYFLRGVFYKSGSTNYCGLTWNGTDWYSGPYTSDEGWKHFLPVSVENNSIQVTLKAKIDPSDSGCKESGVYNFKVERFTASGSGSYDTQNALTVSVNVPPSPLPTPTNAPTPKPVSPTKVPTITKSPTNKPTIKILQMAITGTKEILGEKDLSSGSAEPTTRLYIATDEGVLTSDKVPPSSVPTPLVLGESTRTLPTVLMILGTILLVSCGILTYLIYRRQANKE